MTPRRSHRQDSNHGAIRSAFEGLGCSVADLSALGNGCPDILVGLGGLCIPVEIKDGSKFPSKRRLTDDETKWHAAWKGGVKIVENLDGVVETVNLLKRWHQAIREAP